MKCGACGKFRNKTHFETDEYGINKCKDIIIGMGKIINKQLTPKEYIVLYQYIERFSKVDIPYINEKFISMFAYNSWGEVDTNGQQIMETCDMRHAIGVVDKWIEDHNIIKISIKDWKSLD